MLIKAIVRHKKRQKEKRERGMQINRLGEVEGWRETEGGRLSGSDAFWAGSQG